MKHKAIFAITAMLVITSAITTGLSAVIIVDEAYAERGHNIGVSKGFQGDESSDFKRQGKCATACPVG